MKFSFDLGTLLIVFKQIKEFITKESENTNKALELTNEAFIDTYDYLKNKKGEYKTNTMLAKKWR